MSTSPRVTAIDDRDNVDARPRESRSDGHLVHDVFELA
jgi:hypothetical protein